MDPEYKKKVDLLQSIVHDGIAKLLAEAKKKDFLEPPYGRAAFPTPLITEDQFISEGALESDDAEPEFHFEYGFDPLKFLSDFIIWSHPNSVEDRRQKKIDAAKFLQRRADHARLQMSISHGLSILARDQSSGILWGPIITPVSCTSIMVSCKPIKMGKIIFQLSKFRDFREITQREEVAVDANCDESEVVGLGDILPVKVTFQGLKAANKYFIRCCLSSNPNVRVIPAKKPGDVQVEELPIEEDDPEGLDFKGILGGDFMKSEFWTLPSEDRAAAEAIVEEEPTAKESTHEHHRHRRHSHQHHSHHGSHHGSNHGSHHHSKVGTESSLDLAVVEGASMDYAPVLINCIGQLPIEAFVGIVAPTPEVSIPEREAVLKTTDPYCPTITCLLGDVLVPPEANALDLGEANGVADRTALLQSVSKVLARCPVFAGTKSSLHNSSFILGWRDSSTGSNYSLRAEELAHKQFRSELKRHKRKFAKMKSSNGNSTTATLHMPPLPTIARLPFTDSVRSILQGLPIDPQLFMDPIPEQPAASTTGSKVKPNPAVQAAAAAAAAQAAADNVKATRMMYRTVMMGPDVVLIVLDMRGQGTVGDYLGKEQATWLDLVLQESAAIQWKIILCGKTFGLINVPNNQAEELAAELEQMSIQNSTAEGENESSGESKFVEGTAEPLVTGVQQSVGEVAVLDGINEEREMEAAADAPVSKQVQLPHDSDKTHAAITAAMSEGFDETYGRSLCSLQHILAVHQARLHEGFDPYLQKSAESKVVHVTSGILLLTSGQASLCPHLVASVANHHPMSAQQDSASPAYVAGFTNLSAPSAHNAHDIEAQLLPTYDKVSRRVPSQLFCAEISLGRIGDLGNVRPDTAGDAFYYRDGIESTTIFSAHLAPSETDPGSELTARKSALRSVASCSLLLQSNGQMKLKLSSADPVSKMTSDESIFECVLEAPIPEDDDEEENED